MKSFKQTFLATLLMTSATTPAFAGVSDSINNYFTFREEQKPLVAPNRDLPPIEVISPNYDERRAGQWSRYYTREDLAPSKYIDDSSMVMRPTVAAPKTRPEPQPTYPGQTRGGAVTNSHGMVQHSRVGAAGHARLADGAPEGGRHYLQQQVQPHQVTAYPHMNVQGHPAQGQGYGMIANRDRLNKSVNTDKKIYLAEPGSQPHNSYSTGQAGRGTIIDEPKYAWNDKEGRQGYATPRPGDFDYQPEKAEDVTRHMMESQGYELSRSSGYTETTANNLRERSGGTEIVNQEQMPHFNGNTTVINLPDHYVVQPLDSLSSISDQSQIYGDWKLWPLIYDANSYQINDPDLIHPGQNLQIRRDAQEDEKQRAKVRAENKRAPYDFYDGQ